MSAVELAVAVVLELLSQMFLLDFDILHIHDILARVIDHLEFKLEPDLELLIRVDSFHAGANSPDSRALAYLDLVGLCFNAILAVIFNLG